MSLFARSTRRRLAVGATAASLVALGLVPATAGTSAQVEQGTGSDSLVPVANLQYAKAAASTSTSAGPNRGTDIEFAEIGGTQYALAGTYENGLQVIDIDEPARPRLETVFDCGVVQGDVQVFEQGERTYVGFTHDVRAALQGTACFTQLKARGFAGAIGERGLGTVIADITNVKDIQAVSFVPFPKGSHNHTIHPSGNYIYNSNSELIANAAANEIEIYDISDLAEPKPLPALDLPPVPTSLGADSHDITFNDEGTRAYSAALSQTVIIDTTDPAAPEVISTIVDPTINVVHQSDPVTLKDRASGVERDFLVIEDEFVGAIGTGQCPNGGVHVYDVTGERERTPVKVGYWNIGEVRTTSDTAAGRCTAHVFDLHEEAAVMTIAYYNGGVRVVDLSGLVGVALGDDRIQGGMREVGFRRFPNSDTWAAKTPKVQPDGSFWLFGNDQRRGLDVYRYDSGAQKSSRPGTWMDAEQAALVLGQRPELDLGDYQLMCMGGGATA